jgi:hypothetical protein
MIAYDMAYKFTPKIAPEYLARKRMALGRVDNEGVRHALQGQRSKKGILDLGIKSILCSQVRHHFVLEHVRVSTTDNVLADPLSRGDIAAFMAAAAPMELELVRMRLSPAQRSTTHYAEARALFGA